MKNKKIAVIGSGAMATAVSKVIFDSGFENISIYGVDQKELSDLQNGLNTKYFSEKTKLPKFNTTTEIKEAVNDADWIIIAVPSKVMHFVVNDLKSAINKDTAIINVAKGFFPGTKLSLHEGISKEMEGNKLIRGVISLIGPSHAEEIVLEVPTAVAVVGTDKELLRESQELFKNEYFRTYIQTDVKGAEVGAAYKNVLAIASGISSGLGYGINTTAALLTRGIAEMIRFNEFMGGEHETIMGLTGIGDLIVTATSPLSRNFTFGKNLALMGSKALETDATVEGLVALDVIYEIAKSNDLNLPIVFSLKEIIEGNDAKKIVFSLWSRDLKSE